MVRSCFGSAWRLFRGEKFTTPGVYIFCDDDTPFYPGWHNYWSRDWISDELEGAELGEDPAAVRSYANGAPLGWVPAPALIGSGDCVQNGERWPLTVVPTLASGFDVRCPELVTAPRDPFDVRDPSNWCFWSQVLRKTYTDAEGALRLVAAALGVPPVGDFQESAEGFTPPFFILNSAAPEPIVVGIAGTTSALQWLGQINYGIGPPRDMGTFGTNLIWYIVSSNILNVMLAAGVDATRPIIVVGHSLGGAVGSVLCARLRQGNPTRTIQLLTSGSPQPGDQRLIAIMRTLQVVSLQNDGDVVLSLPVNLGSLPFALSLAFGSLWLGNPFTWEPPPNRFRISWDGEIRQGAAEPGVGNAVLSVLIWAFLSGPTPDLSEHVPAEYERRLCRPAPLPVFWVSADDLNQADGEQVALAPNRVDPTNSPAQPLPSTGPILGRDLVGMRVQLGFLLNERFAIPSPIGGGSAFACYFVCKLYYRPGSAPNSYRIGVPLMATDDPNDTAGSWGGPTSSFPGWTVSYGGVSCNVPLASNNPSPALLSIRWDGSTLSLRAEDGEVVTASASGVATPASWPTLGGLTAKAQDLPTASFGLAEVLFFQHNPTDDEDASYLEYLRSSWLLQGQAIATESGDVLTTESGDVLVT